MTECKNAEMKLKEHQTKLSKKNVYEMIINEVTRSVHQSINIQDVMQNAVDVMVGKIDKADAIGIYLIEGDEAVLKAHNGLTDRYIERAGRIPYPKGVTWKTIIDNKPLYIPDVDKDKVLGVAGRFMGIKSHLSTPIHYEGNTVGCISISSFKTNMFDEEELKLLAVISHQIEIAINNARQTEALRQSEERYRTLFEQSPLGVYIFDKEYKITQCNERLVQILRSSFEKVVGLDIRTLKNQCVLPFMKMVLEGQKASYEGLYEATYSQAKLWISINLSPLRDSAGNVIGGMAVVEDITQRKREEEKLRILHSITQALNQSLELEEIYKIAMDSVIELENVDLACIYLIDESRNEAVMQVHRNFPDDFLQRAGRIPFPKGATWKVINNCEMLNVKNAREDPDVGLAGRDLGFRSMLGIPVTIEGKAIGVLWLLSYVEYQFTEPEVELLTSIGNQIAVAIAKANLYRDLSRKKRYEEIVSTVTRSVHQSFDLQDVLENAVDVLSKNVDEADRVGIYLVEEKEAVLKAHRGYTDQDIDRAERIPYPKGVTWKTIIEGKHRYCSDVDKVTFIDLAGSEIGIKSFLCMPINYVGKTVGTLNITSFHNNPFNEEELNLLGIVSRQIELAFNNARQVEALRNSEERYRALYDDNPSMYFTVDSEGKVLSVNQFGAEQLGYTVDELVGQSVIDVFHEEEKQGVLQQLTYCLQNPGQSFHWEFRKVRKDGSMLWVREIARAVRGADGNPVVLVVCEDITERKSIEEALRKSEERLNYIFDNTPNVAIQGFDIEGRVIYWNKAAEKIFGWSKDEAIGKTLDKLILDEETTHEFHSVLKKVTEKKEPFGPSEWKFINCEGREGTVISTIFPIPSSSGESEFICMDIDITERKRQEAQIHHMAMHDSLTDLPNRRALQEKLEHITSKTDHRKTHAFVVMDLDNFKLINDTLGYLQADQVLVDLAKIMRKTMRPEDLLARVGGDEFAMVIQNVSRDEAKTIAERFYNAINRYSSFLKGYSFQLGVSIGINLFDRKTDPQMIMPIAYSALAAAKYEGKNRVIIYHSEEYNGVELNQASQWCIRINDAVRENRLILQFQPVIRLDSSKALYMEALVRMRDVANSTILPKAFIPVAERFGLMSKIDRWVVERVIKSINKNTGVRIFVNLSGSSLRDESLLEFIQDAINGNKLISNSIGFEITEFANITNIDRLNQWMIGLKEIGCQFALDDFGMGHFSFAHLLKLPVDFVKIESSFIQNMDTDPTSSAIVKAIIKVSRLMGKEVIAEGVETEAVANILSRLKIKYGQGNYWSTPADDNPFIY